MKTRLTLFAMSLVVTGCSVTSKHTHNHHQVEPHQHYEERVKPVYIDARNRHIVPFEHDSAALPFDAAEIVEPHARYLHENPDIKVALQGSASSPGGSDYNYELGLKRANAVKRLFKELGVDEARIIVMSIGETKASYSPSRNVTITY